MKRRAFQITYKARSTRCRHDVHLRLGVIDVTELRRHNQLVTQNEISRKAMKTSALDSSYSDYDAISEPACACGIF